MMNKNILLKILVFLLFTFLHAEETGKEQIPVQINNGRNCSVYFSDYNFFSRYNYEYKNEKWHLSCISLDYNDLKRDRKNNIYVDAYPYYLIDFIPKKQHKEIMHERIKSKHDDCIFYLLYSVRLFRFSEYSCYVDYDDYRKELLESGFICIGEIKDGKLVFNISDKDMNFTEDYTERIIDLCSK